MDKKECTEEDSDDNELGVVQEVYISKMWSDGLANNISARCVI